MKINYSRAMKNAVEPGLKAIKDRLTKVVEFADDAGLDGGEFSAYKSIADEIQKDLAAAFRPRENSGQKYHPTDADILFDDQQRTILKAAMELSARHDEQLIAKHENTMPASLIVQLRGRVEVKRSMLVGPAFDNLDHMSLLASWGIDSSLGAWLLVTADSP